MNFYEQGSQAALVKLGFLRAAWGELGRGSQQALKQYGAGAGVGAGIGGLTGAAAAPEGSGGTGFMLGALGGGLLGGAGGRMLGKRMATRATEAGEKEVSRLMAEGMPERHARGMMEEQLTQAQTRAFPGMPETVSRY